MPTWNMMLMQDPATLMEMHMTTTHNMMMEIMTLVAAFILMLMMCLVKNKMTNSMTTQNNMLEIVWTLLPMMMLVYMAAPSLQLLYMLEETNSPSMTIKAIGHQWYWTYEYPDFKKTFDSYMSPNMSKNKFRLLDVDSRMIIPFNVHTRILCTSNDVIHSWALPSMGMKMDATPGRINQMVVMPTMMGVFYGQCSEICGVNHSFMPIVVEVVSADMFIKWIKMNTP